MYVTHPKYQWKIFLDNSVMNFEERLKIVQEKILNDKDIVDFCRNNSYLKNKHQQNAYIKATKILEQCSTYLLLGQYKANGIMTIYNIRQARVKEIFASLTDNIDDMMYADSDLRDEDIHRSIKETNNNKLDSDYRSQFKMSSGDIMKKEKHEEKRRFGRKGYNKSNAYRMEKLTTTPSLNTYRVVPLYEMTEDGKSFKRDEKRNKIPVKNVFKQPVYDAVEYIIGGNKGIIDKDNKYKIKWCIVDTDNIFWYNSQEFNISSDLDEYKVGKDNQCSMDRVMVIPTKEGLKFFNQNINEITDFVSIRENSLLTI